MKPAKNAYLLPIPPDTAIEKIVTDSPGHPGPYRGAVDFAVPVGTDVLAPFDGKVIAAVDTHSRHGADPKYAKSCNYVQIAHPNGEISDLIHLAAGSIMVQKGDKVIQGQKLAETGLSGYMTAPHLHWFVFVRDDSIDGFHGLLIRT
jgi:murein DD-endopeptidase MepM/ murein hydrolase activator NlpD